MKNFSSENVFDLHDKEPVERNNFIYCFHMKTRFDTKAKNNRK